MHRGPTDAMTTRDQVRRRPGDAARAADSARGAVTAIPAPSLPERLLAARERKGVDLYRAERDTKIRARYLAALERGDWRELPGAVYTKGFLRNYALYLGLDPEDIIVQWRAERGDDKPSEPVIVVPRAIQAPARGFTFSPGILVALLLVVGVVAFAAYMGVQVLRFAKPPTIAVTDPATAVFEVDESTTKYTLRGTSVAGATVSVTTPGEDPHRTSVQQDGTWSVDVDLRRGRNQFDITATDPETGKQADQAARVFITVPFSVVQAPTLTLDQPSDGITVENGAIPVQGKTTNATTVTVSASYQGPAPLPAARPSPSGSGAAGASPAAPVAAPKPPTAPAPQTMPVAADGSFNAGVELTAGKWTITVTASSAQNKTTTLTRNVTVQFKGVNLVISIDGGPAWIKVWVDGQVDPSTGQAGKIFASGRTLTFTALNSIEVRSGNSGATHFTLNGTSLGALGKDGIPETWLFAPPPPPQKTGRT
ncbi:MAG: cytoskeleton protein RodZ [Solirubrobacteraceae bacterium]|nr:cytoskeleton protein RodZ [Solirubrobacteraceae bacterium]